MLSDDFLGLFNFVPYFTGEADDIYHTFVADLGLLSVVYVFIML